MDITQIRFDSHTGLIPAIIQDAQSGRVLMLGYMNKEALEKTIKEGLVTFFSRSKQRLWTKGEESGNILHLVSIHEDCDRDSLLIKVHPKGPTCHTQEVSCFDAGQTGRVDEQGILFLSYLEALLKERKALMPEGSYTSKMFAKGLDKLAQKVGEEAVETVIAAKNEPNDEFIYEASDLIFHLMMLMVGKEVELSTLIKELERRHKEKK